MTKINCKINDLHEVCRLVAMQGVNQMGKSYMAIRDVVITAKDNKFYIEAIDNLKSLVIKLEYNIAVESEGVIPIGDIERFEEFLSRFNPDDIISLTTTENKIVITRENPKKTLRIAKADVSVIQSKDASPIFSKLTQEDSFWKTPSLKYNLRFVFDSNIVHEAIEDGAVVKQREYPWKIEGDKLFIAVGSENYGEFSHEISLESIEGNGPHKTETVFSSGVDNLFGNLEGKVTASLVDGAEISPLIIEKKTEKYNLFAMLAPHKISK
jgi:hypothetical protein